MGDRYKFRAKGKVSGLWYYGSPVEDYLISEGWIKNQIDPETLGQSTGLKDKNGKLIYEGDIVNCRYLYRPKRYGTFAVKRYGGAFMACCRQLIELRDIEIIGNIYENPDLLGGNDEH